VLKIMATTVFEDLLLIGLKVFGYDASTFNDDYATEKKPDLILAIKFGFAFAGFRGGYGVIMDRIFGYYWKLVKGIIPRLCYWYLDYYSHINEKMGIDGVEWGKRQARAAWETHKNDPGECPLYLDIESVGNKNLAANITWLNADKVMQIARAFLTEYDRLSGGFAGIYCSIDFLRYFGDWFRDRPIWVAWYDTRAKDPAKVIALVKSHKWRRLTDIIVQFASHGDMNGDGVGDGYAMGFESRNLDLNYYIGTLEQWSAFVGTTAAVPVETDQTPEDEVVTEPEIFGSNRTIRTAKTVGYLNLRTSPKTGTEKNIIRVLPPGKAVDCLERVIEGSNTWWRVGLENQYVAEKYNGITYLN
jgi:hypothetical protein